MTSSGWRAYLQACAPSPYLTEEDMLHRSSRADASDGPRLYDYLVPIGGVLACVAFSIAGVLEIRAMASTADITAIPTFLAVLAVKLAQLGDSPLALAPLKQWYLGLWLVHITLFGALFWTATQPNARRARRGLMALLLAQAAIGLGGHQDMLALEVVEFAFLLPPRGAVAALLAVLIAFLTSKLPFLLGMMGPRSLFPQDAIFASWCFIGSTWNVVMFGVGHIAGAERRGRTRLAQAHGELLGTQILLADAVRASERARIARDLHDGIGHHLTALKLHLELASHQPEARGNEALRISRDLAQNLLQEVRSVVGLEHQRRTFHLRHALSELCAGIPHPKIELVFDERIEIDQPLVANEIFRSVQEAISNAMRHAGARTLQVTLAHGADGVTITVVDDGSGCDRLQEGNGLRGMRERIRTIGGELKLGNMGARGFGVHIRLPGRFGEHGLSPS